MAGTGDLHEVRRRIALSHYAERRWLEQTIHAGAQQHLVALAVRLGLAASVAVRDPQRVAAVIGELQREASGAVKALRDLAREIYPPLLADQGLGPALRDQVARRGGSLEAAPADRYPPELESVLYDCCAVALARQPLAIRVQEENGALSLRLRSADGAIDPEARGRVADWLLALGGTVDTLHPEALVGQAPIAEVGDDELRASCRRLLVMRDTTRRRLERDLHDGIQQQLVALSVELTVARQRLERDPAGSAAHLEELSGRAHAALESLRDLARRVFPPLLAEQGLVVALNAHIRKRQLPATVETELAATRFEPSVETAAYFGIIQAMADAPAGTPMTVRLGWGRGMLTFTVSAEGTTLQTRPLQDCVEALDGSVQQVEATVSGWLPAEPVQPAV
ncbi:MAG: histidine kinase [Actinomycetota bacterium]|nr:histidine kinase [Actinomycetota bacterium]